MNKYRAIRTNGFTSKGEHDCYQMLKLREKAGEITDIECQVTSELTAGITHKTDFKVWDRTIHEFVFIEFKGFEDHRWLLIKKLWKVYGPGRLQIYKGKGLRMILVEEIIPSGKSL